MKQSSKAETEHLYIPLLIAQVKGLQWVVRLLWEHSSAIQSPTEMSDDDKTRLIGSIFGAAELGSLAAELALKALVAQNHPERKALKTHFLDDLFDELPPDVRSKVEDRFQVLRTVGVAMRQAKSQPDSTRARDVLNRSRSAYTDFKYVAESRSASGAPAPDLMDVTTAALDVCLQQGIEENPVT